jgi:NRPS condensation-like uncharacterized protein
MPLKIKPENQQSGDWLPLDNAAKIFPAVSGNELTIVFRLMAELDRPVNFAFLQSALTKTLERLPYFTYRLHRGFFWYWLEADPDGVDILPDAGLPCRAFHYKRNRKDMCRVLAKDNRISGEFFHSLTDGSGALEFMKVLLAYYAETSGFCADKAITGLSPIPDLKELTEDSYNRYFKSQIPVPDKLRKAYHLPFPHRRAPRLRVLATQVPANQIKERSKALGITVTEYLVSVYLWALQEIYHQVKPNMYSRKRTAIRIQVPVNMRKLFPSKTLRNFALFVMPEIDTCLGHYSFAEIVKTVRFFMERETDPKQLQRTIFRNVRGERYIFIRLVPLFIKNMILAFHFRNLGMELYSGLITNLGKIELPAELGGMVKRFRFYPPPPDTSRVTVASVTLSNEMVITFLNSSTSRLLERKFVDYLRCDGIDVKLLNP